MSIHDGPDGGCDGSCAECRAEAAPSTREKVEQWLQEGEPASGTLAYHAPSAEPPPETK